MIHGLPESVLRKGTMTAQAETGATKKNRGTLVMCDEDDAGTILNLLEENGIDADLI